MCAHTFNRLEILLVCLCACACIFSLRFCHKTKMSIRSSSRKRRRSRRNNQHTYKYSVHVPRRELVVLFFFCSAGLASCRSFSNDFILVAHWHLHAQSVRAVQFCCLFIRKFFSFYRLFSVAVVVVVSQFGLHHSTGEAWKWHSAERKKVRRREREQEQ